MSMAAAVAGVLLLMRAAMAGRRVGVDGSGGGRRGDVNEGGGGGRAHIDGNGGGSRTNVDDGGGGPHLAMHYPDLVNDNRLGLSRAGPDNFGHFDGNARTTIYHSQDNRHPQSCQFHHTGFNSDSAHRENSRPAAYGTRPANGIYTDGTTQRSPRQ